MQNKTKPGYLPLLLAIACMLAAITFAMAMNYARYGTLAEMKLTNISGIQYASVEQHAPNGHTAFSIEYVGDFSAQASRRFAEVVDGVLVASSPGDVVIMNVDSMGGELRACSNSFNQVERLKEAGLIVIGVSDYSALSCGYLLLSAAQEVFVAEAADVGNIGVVMNMAPGIGNAAIIGTTKLKEALAGGMATQSAVDEVRSMVLAKGVKMVQMIMRERGDNIKRDNLAFLTDGRVLSGDDAVRLGLADRVGTLNELLLSHHVAGWHVVGVKYN